jgi:hypothetical protein
LNSSRIFPEREMPDVRDTSTSFPIALPTARLTDREIQRLNLWAKRSTLPAWRVFDPSMASTPPETITRLISEWQAMRSVLELVGEFAGDLGELLRRLEGAGQ